jgi:hypothetical protein
MSSRLFSQTGVDSSAFQKVLLKNQRKKEFIYDKTKGKIADKTWLKYLGNVTTKEGKTYKIVTHIWVWGYSQRGTTRILLFDRDNQYVGKFVLGMTYEVPSKVIENRMIFEFPKNVGCDHAIKREVSFSDGIPKQFFLECKNGMGDIFYFDNTK